MRYTPEHAEATRARVLDVCGRQFRERGFGGIGVEGLSREAKVTSGAFYNHFGSKAGAFRAAVAAGAEHLRRSVEQFRHGGYGARWLAAFAEVYLSPSHRGDVAGGCALPSLSAEVARSDAMTRAAYEAELLKVAALIADGLPGNPGREAAWPILALLVGGVMLSRAVPDEAVAQEIADAVLNAVLTSARPVPAGSHQTADLPCPWI
jgi:TetR/AcrR family transcriptional regulator, transcriptional repressor for nem operon